MAAPQKPLLAAIYFGDWHVDPQVQLYKCLHWLWLFAHRAIELLVMLDIYKQKMVLSRRYINLILFSYLIRFCCCRDVSSARRKLDGMCQHETSVNNTMTFPANKSSYYIAVLICCRIHRSFSFLSMRDPVTRATYDMPRAWLSSLFLQSYATASRLRVYFLKMVANALLGLMFWFMRATAAAAKHPIGETISWVRNQPKWSRPRSHGAKDWLGRRAWHRNVLVRLVLVQLPKNARRSRPTGIRVCVHMDTRIVMADSKGHCMYVGHCEECVSVCEDALDIGIIVLCLSIIKNTCRININIHWHHISSTKPLTLCSLSG